jgi:hypothetical protein
MKKISSNLSTNFQKFLSDQKSRVELIKKIQDDEPDMVKFEFSALDIIMRVAE